MEIKAKIMKQFIGIFLITVIYTIVPGLSETKPSQNDDVTSLSNFQIVEDGQRIPKVEELESLEIKSRELLVEGKCEEAEMLDYAGSANMLANIVRQGIEPFYQADRDQQTSLIIGHKELWDEIKKAEKYSNLLIRQRNEFWFLEAKCYFDRNETEKALVRLYRSLEFINMSTQNELWEQVRTMLWSMVGYE